MSTLTIRNEIEGVALLNLWRVRKKQCRCIDRCRNTNVDFGTAEPQAKIQKFDHEGDQDHEIYKHRFSNFFVSLALIVLWSRVLILQLQKGRR
jgi:hypothetical protein